MFYFRSFLEKCSKIQMELIKQYQLHIIVPHGKHIRILNKLTVLYSDGFWFSSFVHKFLCKSYKMVAFLFSCGKPKFLYRHRWMYWTDLPCRFRYSRGGGMGQPDMRWQIVSVCLSHTLHFGSVSFFNMFCWNVLVGGLCYCVTMMMSSL